MKVLGYFATLLIMVSAIPSEEKGIKRDVINQREKKFAKVLPYFSSSNYLLRVNNKNKDYNNIDDGIDIVNRHRRQLSLPLYYGRFSSQLDNLPRKPRAAKPKPKPKGKSKKSKPKPKPKPKGKSKPKPKPKPTPSPAATTVKAKA